MQLKVDTFLQQIEKNFSQGLAYADSIAQSPANADGLIKALQIKKDNADAIAIQAYLFLLQGKITLGSEKLLSVERNGGHEFLPLLQGQLHLLCKDYPRAVQSFADMVNAKPQDFFCWQKLLSGALLAGWFEQGGQWYQQAVNLNHWQDKERMALMDKGAALLVHQYQFAETIAICQKQLALVLKTSADKKPQSKQQTGNWDAEKAWQTLKNILQLLESKGFKPFPTAGTLLGWEREGDLLPFDKDLDIAFPPQDSLAEVKHVLQMRSEYEIPSLSMNYTSMFTVVDRRTGLTVDLLGFEEGEQDNEFDYGWFLPGRPRSEGRLINIPTFELQRKQWKDLSLWSPSNADDYLTALYGDWRKPNPEFDGVVGVNNLTSMTPLVRAFGYNNLMTAIQQGKWKKAVSSLSALQEKGDNSEVLRSTQQWLNQQMQQDNGI